MIKTDSSSIFDVLELQGADEALLVLCRFEHMESIERLAEKISIPADKIAAIQEVWQFLELLDEHFPQIVQNRIFQIEKECAF